MILFSIKEVFGISYLVFYVRYETSTQGIDNYPIVKGSCIEKTMSMVLIVLF